MRELVAKVDALLADIGADGSNAYLRSALVEFRQAVDGAIKPEDARNAGRALTRFCVEHMDWDTDLFRRCSSLAGLTGGG